MLYCLEKESMTKLFQIREIGQKAVPPRLLTFDDLEEFRVKLMMDIKRMLEGHLNKTAKRWVKSCEVRKMLGISAGTLQTLRDNGKMPFTRIGRLIYYDVAEIDNLLGSHNMEF
jgi:hypothetical protein